MFKRLVNRLTPNLTDQGCFLAFWLARLEIYKLRAPLHLWIREHLYLFVYLLVLALKALILFLVHEISICIFFSASLWFILTLSCILVIVELGWEIKKMVKTFKWVETWRDCVRAHYSRNPSVKVIRSLVEVSSISGTLTWLGAWGECM